MKKLFYFAVVLLGFAACNKDENQEGSIDNQTTINAELISQATDFIENALSDYGSYEPDQIVRLLAGKEFQQWCYLEYDSSWSEIISNYYSFGKGNDVGGFGADYYTFSADGTVSRRYVVTAIAPPDNVFEVEGEWAFDPASRKLTTTFLTDAGESIREFTLRALGEKIFVWDEVKNDTMKNKLRYFRSVYIVQ